MLVFVILAVNCLNGWADGPTPDLHNCSQRPAFKETVFELIEEYFERAETQEHSPSPSPRRIDFKVQVDDDPVLGDPKAPITIVEFSDVTCPFCREHFEQVTLPLIETYVSSGLVRIAFKGFPLDVVGEGFQAAVASNCVRAQGGDQAYFAFHMILNRSDGALDNRQLTEIAGKIGLDTAAFNRCLTGPEPIAEVVGDIQQGDRYGVTGTPSFFINQIFLDGSFPLDTFVEIIERELRSVDPTTQEKPGR